MINFEYEKLKRDVNDIIKLRNEIEENRDKFHKLSDRVRFWFYVKVMNVLILIGKYMIKIDEKGDKDDQSC